jgi:hypothetical protein
VDAEAEVNDSNFKLTLNRKQVWRMNNKSLQKLAIAVGIENVPKTATKIKEQIIELLSPVNLDATLDKVEDLPAAKNIYRLVFGNNPDSDMGLAAIKDMIRRDINENLDQVIDISTPVKKTTAKSQGETKSTGPTEPTEDEKQKTKFNKFWEIVKDMNKKDINNKITSLKKSQKDVKKMLTEFQKLLDKNGPYLPSFKARGDFLAGVADKNSNKTLTEDEIRKIIKGTPKLKELFRIGKTGELNENLEPFVSWGISRTTIDTDKNGIYTLEEFAQYYLAAVLKKKGRDQLTGTYYKPDTFAKMLKLFGIGEEEEEEEEEEEDEEEEGETKKDSPEPKQDSSGGETKDAHPGAKTPPKTKVWYNGSPYTLRDLNKDETKWSLTDGVKRFKNGKGFDFEDISLIPPPAPQTTLPTFNVGNIVKNLSTKGRNVDSLGIITEMKKEEADVTWQDGNQTNDKKLTDLQLVTIDPATEKKINDIFDFYDKNKDNKLTNGEDRTSLLENLKASKVYTSLDQFNVDGIAGFSREEFRFLLTVRPIFIKTWDKKQKQRTREEDADKAAQKKLERLARQEALDKQMQERADSEQEADDRQAAAIKIQAVARTRQQKEQARQKQEQARQAALDRQEQAKKAARLEKEKAVLENQKRNEAEKQQRDADEKKIIVEKKDGKYFVRQTKAYKDYKEKLEGPDGIPETACKPEITTNN